MILPVFALTLLAAGAQAQPEHKGKGGPGGGGFMDSLTEEQKTCVKAKRDACGDDRECGKKAFEECGVAKPERKGKPSE
jgi:hypothetical protein